MRLIDGHSAVRASVLTDTQGRFVLAGPPGAYTLQVMSPKVVRCATPAVNLPLSATVAMTIHCDSGMR